MTGPSHGTSKVLLKTHCMRSVGPLAQVGELVLTEEEIRFTPRGLERLVGAGHVTIDVLQIDELSPAGRFNSEVRIRVGEEVHRFSGRGASWLAQRLRSLLLDSGGELRPFEQFERDEHVVVCGDISVYLLGFLATRGEVIITDRRIRVRTTGGIESWFLGKRQLDVGFVDLRKVERRGIRQALTITKDQTRVAIGGGVAPEVAAGLGAVLIDAEVPGRWTQHVGLEAVYEAQLQQGPRYIPGILAVSTRALQFTPSGRLDSAVGAREITIDLEDIYRVGLSGRGEPKLEVYTEERKVSLILENSGERFVDLTETLQNMEPESPLGARPLEYISSMEVDCFLSGWDTHLEPEEQIRTLDWSLRWIDERTVLIGWLMLTTYRVVFLPSAGPEGTPQLETYVLDEMGRLTEDPGSPRLRFAYQTQVMEFTQANGTSYVQKFWQQCNVATVMKSSQKSRRSRTLRRLEGRVAFLRVLKNGQEVLRVDDCRLVCEMEGLGLKLRPEESELLEKLGSGQVEIGRREGVYSFDMRVNRVAALDEGEFLSGREKIVLVALSQVSLTNRREGFRVDVSFIVDVIFSGSIEKEGNNCVIDDLSICGVALSVPWSLPHGVVAEFELPVIGEPLQVRARVVRLIHEGGGIRRWRYALAFYGLEDVDRSRINQLVLDQQRKRLRS